MGAVSRILLFCALLFMSMGFTVFAQDSSSKGAKDTNEAPLKKVEPIFPDENKYLVFFEGEDAVSTNFNKEPTQNYSCSGSRSLQLSRTTNLQAGATFYADYVFYIEDDGTYELWYGGTPPGPKGDLYPSFSSPFKYSIDDTSKARSVYREDMTVVENYAPSFYWNLVREENLTKGRHQLHISVNEKRAYDGRFYFYLDCLFFVKKEGATRLLGNKLPAIFPKNLDERKMNQPFKPLDDYLIFIRDNPEAITPLVEVSLIYSLVGDYLNAVKHLKRALFLAPDDINIKLLLAKNYIWMQEISTGLDLYKEILQKDPSKVGIWMEAGKVSGWTGRFKDSTDFFSQGLAAHPDSLDLLVNMGLSFLWAGDTGSADKAIQDAKAKAGKDPEKIKSLAKVFMVNGYPEKAEEIYKQGIEIAPADLQLYLLLEDSYLNSGKKTEADDVKNTISKRFISSSKLSRYLDFYHEKIGLKDKVLEGYRTQLASQPDNLELREMLAQTYFWNGLRDDAIREYLNILTNKAFRELKSMEQGSSELLEKVDKLSILSGYFGKIEKIISDKSNQIAAQSAKYKAALSGPAPKLNQEAALLSSLVADGEELAKRHAQVSAIYKTELESAASIIDKANKDEESSQKVMKSIQWEWDKHETLAELEEVSKNGFVLADHMLGRISQLDNNLADSKIRFEKILNAGPYPEADFSYWETLLWSGNTDGANQFFAVNKKDMQSYMPYMGNIGTLADLTSGQVSGSAGDSGGDLTEKAKTITDRLSSLTPDAQSNRRKIDDSLTTMRAGLGKKLVYAFYNCQENTFLLRNELGDFYLKNNAHNKAITQYKQVLAIDPYNLSAIYRLGTVYQRKQDWYEAMGSFNKVYQADPNYENAASLYNGLARQFADETIVTANSFTDTSRVYIGGDVNYWKSLNSMIKFGAGYSLDYTLLYRTWNDPKTQAFMVNGVGLGLMFDLYGIGLKITPAAGANVFVQDKFYADAKNGTVATLYYLSDFLGALSAEPFAKLNFTLAIGDIFSAWGDVGYRRLYDTYALHIPDVFEIWTEPSFVFKFSFLNIYPYKESYIRVSPNFEYLLDNDPIMIIKPIVEAYLPLLSIDNPNIVLSLTGTLDYENAFNTKNDWPATLYYKPFNVFQILGQAGIYMKFGAREKIDVPDLSVKFGGGYFSETVQNFSYYPNRIFENHEHFKWIGDVMLRLNGDKGSFGIGGDINLTMSGYDTAWNWRSDVLGFWSAEIKIEYTSKLTSLLAP